MANQPKNVLMKQKIIFTDYVQMRLMKKMIVYWHRSYELPLNIRRFHLCYVGQKGMDFLAQILPLQVIKNK